MIVHPMAESHYVSELHETREWIAPKQYLQVQKNPVNYFVKTRKLKDLERSVSPCAND